MRVVTEIGLTKQTKKFYKSNVLLVLDCHTCKDLVLCTSIYLFIETCTLTCTLYPNMLGIITPTHPNAEEKWLSAAGSPIPFISKYSTYFELRLGIFGNFAPRYSRLISGGILGSQKLPLQRKSYTHCIISNYQHTSVNRIVIARNRKPLCSDLPFKMRWFRPSNPIKCVLSTVKFNKIVCFCSQRALLHN